MRFLRRLVGERKLLAPHLILVVAAIAALAPVRLDAAGNESTRRAHDLATTVDTRWAGGANGGYYPIRIRLTNTARPRALLFRFVDTSHEESRLPAVDRRVQVDQNSTAQFTLSIPLVSPSTNGELRVYEGGRLLEEFTHHISFPDATPMAPDRPSLLVIHPAPATIDCTKFEEGVKASNPSRGGGGGPWGGGYSSTRDNDFQVIAPLMLPESWVDYSALDVVAIPLATLGKIPAAARAALLDWCESGGTLVVTEVGEPASQSKELARLLDLASRPQGSTTWQDAKPSEKRDILSMPDGTMTGGMAMGGMPVPMPPAGTTIHIEGAEGQNVLAIANKSLWKIDAQTFGRVDLLAGRVYAFPDNPFPGAAVDWYWWLNSADWSNRLRWTARLGNSTRDRHPDFFQFLVPGVGAVPVVAFMVLITLFAIAIGPVNYMVALRRKQLYLLVITIPAIAFLTSLSLFGYAVVADGFGVQSRLRSFTMLDQRTKHAVSFNRISLYAGMAPSSGLKFSHETAVLPIWQDDSCFEAGEMDWTDKQALQAGWLRSRTPAQFETVVHRTERGRVEFSPAGADGIPEAANGLEWEIDALVVRDESGRVFAGHKLPAGGSLRLHPAEDKDVQSMVSLLESSRLEAPPGATSNEWNPLNSRSRRRMMLYGMSPVTTFSSSASLLERGLARVSQATRDPANGGLAPRSYFATFRENPGIELGIEGSRAKGGVHVLLGYY